MTTDRRPQTRSECFDGPRPCPWVSCRHHLALEVRDGEVILMLPADPTEWADLPTCALDVAYQGGMTQVGLVALLTGTQYTMRRVRDAEAKGINALRERLTR